MKTGEKLVLIGNPHDGLPFSWCTEKKIGSEEELVRKPDPKNRWIALDAIIVSGYSGGSVFNLNGDLIGISNAAYIGDLAGYDFEYLSFIIPINNVKELIEKNCTGGQIDER